MQLAGVLPLDCELVVRLSRRKFGVVFFGGGHHSSANRMTGAVQNCIRTIGEDMSEFTRRKFLQHAAAIGSAALLPATLRANDRDNFDLVIRGGKLLDPSQQLRGRYDIGIRWGRIVSVQPIIYGSEANIE